MYLEPERFENIKKLLYFHSYFLVYFVWYFMITHYIDYIFLPTEIIQNTNRNILKLIVFIPIPGIIFGIFWYIRNLHRLNEI